MPGGAFQAFLGELSLQGANACRELWPAASQDWQHPLLEDEIDRPFRRQQALRELAR